MGNIGEVAGNAGIPCKDFNNGCRCKQCQNARKTHETISNVTKTIDKTSIAGLSCADFDDGCYCNICRKKRNTPLATNETKNWMKQVGNNVELRDIQNVEY